MPWSKIDDQFYDHPKTVAAGPLGIALFICSLSYCARHLTDGNITISQVKRLIDVDDPIVIAEKLVEVGFFERTNDGYKIHDYLNYNPSREQVLKERSESARRQEEWRERKKLSRDSEESNKMNNGITNSVTNTSPVPVPVPVPVPESRSGDDADASAPAKRERKPDLLFDAICKVCVIDPKVKGNGATIGKIKSALLESEPPYTPDEVTAFGTWWNSDTWRSKKGPPTVWKLKEQIGIVRNGGSATKDKLELANEITRERLAQHGDSW